MIKKPITINLSTGLEARPVAQLVQVASQFNSEIYVEIGKKRVNAKSIMGMMTLGLDAGEEITLSANGEDEEAAMAGIPDGKHECPRMTQICNMIEERGIKVVRGTHKE